MDAFLYVLNIFSEKTLLKTILKSFMTRCRNPETLERYKLNSMIYSPESKRILPRTVNDRKI